MNGIRVEKATVLWPQRQTKLLVTTHGVGFSAIKPHEDLYQEHVIFAMNGEVEAQSEQAFHIMVSSYCKTP